MNKKLFQYSYSMKKEHTRKIFAGLFFFIFLVTFVLLILNFLVFPVRQTSVSMTPDIESGSFVLATPLKNNIKRGDVVLLKPQAVIAHGKFSSFCDTMVSFFTAQQFSLYEKKEIPGTKGKFRRVIGIPGDTIYMRDYVMYIKPAGDKHFLTEFELCPKTYNVTFMSVPATWDNSIGVKGYFDEIILGEDEYYVLGDNRKSCDDSRLWGTVSKSDFDAKAFLCYFPFNKFRIF